MTEKKSRAPSLAPVQTPPFAPVLTSPINSKIARRPSAEGYAVAHFQRAMMMDVDRAAKVVRQEEMNSEIEDFIEGFNQPTYRGMRINGVRVATRSSQPTGGPGDSRPEFER